MIFDTGILKTNASYAWLDCCDDIALYYQWFLKKGVTLQSSIWRAHITVIRACDEVEVAVSLPAEFVGKEFPFRYEINDIATNGKHWWIDVSSPELEAFRVDLGLGPQPLYRFHLTLGSETMRRYGCTFGRELRR